MILPSGSRRKEGRSMMYARDVMTTDVISVAPETTIGEIAALLIQHRISAVPVIDTGAIVGIVSEGDLMRRPETDTEGAPSPWLSLLSGPGVAPDRFSKAHGTTAREVMTRNVITVTPDTPLDEVASLLEARRIKRVPVVQDGRLVGILSRANLLHGLVAAPLSADRTESSAQQDRRIRDQVQEVLRKNPWLERDHVNLVVNDSVVHVWGIVRSEEHRKALYMALRAVPGVKSVEDHLSPNWFTNTTA
jgi:CBS-domain-containing membrane protein